ncbi:MAG: bile acid:sodium symporter family protein [Pseudomonadota bacterium]
MTRVLRFLDPYIVLMIATMAIAALLPARGVGAQIAGGAADAGIIFLFFLYGARLSPQAALGGLTHWRLQLAVLLSTYALFPLLGIAVAGLAPQSLSSVLKTGIVFLCLLPSTVQSSIAFTSIARGNVPAALCAASASNILGVFITPLLAGWLLQRGGIALSFDQVTDIVLQLLVPFVAGQLLRRWIGHWVQDHKAVLSYADRGSILLIIYVAFSKGMVDNVWAQIGATDMLLLSVILIGLLTTVLILTYLIGRKLMRLSIEDEIVLLFCGSKKSLASGLPMATVLFPGPQLGLLILPLMLFHQLQLIVCAILARRYGARAGPGPDAA